MVRLENIGMRYGDGPEILRDVNLTLEPGSFHFLSGASGAGKSTLLRLLYLAEKPTNGRISLFDRDIGSISRRELPAVRRKIGVIFQDFRLLDHLSAHDNVALPLRLAGVREETVKEYVTDLMNWVGLANHVDAFPSTLSGGQQQRISIARAVIGQPSLLIADEPTGNVDDELAVRLLYLFEELNRLGTTIVIATHSEALITRFAHPVLMLADGQINVIPVQAKRAS